MGWQLGGMVPANTLPQIARRKVVAAIERLPASPLLLRAYNVGLRALGGPYRAKTYFGATMLCDPGDLIQHCVLHFGMWEPNTGAVIERLLEEGDTCVDVGANVGYDTLLAAHCVGPTGKVISIEASPRIYRLLQANLQENDFATIRTVNKAVSDRRGSIALYSGPSGNLGRTTTLPARDLPYEATVEMLPLDEILTPEERGRLKLIKIDIEGAEAPVMRRLLDTLESYPETMSVLVEVSPAAEWAGIFSDMLDAGFSAFGIHNDYSSGHYLRERHNLAPLEPLASAPDGQLDVLFTRDQLNRIE